MGGDSESTRWHHHHPKKVKLTKTENKLRIFLVTHPTKLLKCCKFSNLQNVGEFAVRALIREELTPPPFPPHPPFPLRSSSFLWW